MADLRKFSAYAKEEEWLLPAGTVFNVQNVKRLNRCEGLQLAILQLAISVKDA